MFIVGAKSVAYLNTYGREALSGVPSEAFFAQPEEKKKEYPAHISHLLSGRPLSITSIKPEALGKGYVIELSHEGCAYELPYTYVSAIFLP